MCLLHQSIRAFNAGFVSWNNVLCKYQYQRLYNRYNVSTSFVGRDSKLMYIATHKNRRLAINYILRYYQNFLYIKSITI